MKEFDIPVEELIEDIRINVVDIEDFNSRVVGAYESGTAERGLEADDAVGRSIVPAATGAFRDFSYIAPDIPEFITENCVGCMRLTRELTRKCTPECKQSSTYLVYRLGTGGGYLGVAAHTFKNIAVAPVASQNWTFPCKSLKEITRKGVPYGKDVRHCRKSDKRNGVRL